jgi:hypothetical protein
LLIIAAASVPVSLLWDFSWESTVGIDRFWSPPHTLNYVAMIFVGVMAIVLWPMARGMTSGPQDRIRLGRFTLPLGGWLVLWSVLAFGTAVLFDRWWQLAYGLGAGIWHPPQILKTISFFAAVGGAWLLAMAERNKSNGDKTASMAACLAGGLALALIQIVTLTSSYPNQQHSASFYKVACATYPMILVALAISGRRWSATLGAIACTATIGMMAWLLPLIPAKPQVGPIYNQMDHLMPPPFPLLLIVPAVVIDLLMKKMRWSEKRGVSWWQAGALGFAFFCCFLIAQWFFAEFLLKPSSDNWFFAGGGKHWPFFLKISPPARVMFWDALPGQPDQLDGANALIALGLSVIAARLGLWIGAWMAKVKR